MVSPVLRVFVAILLALAVVLAQLFYGGLMRTVFGIPAYGLIAISGVLGLAALFWKRAVPPRPGALVVTLVAACYMVWRALNSSSQDQALFYAFLVAACAAVYFLFAGFVTTPGARHIFVCVLLAAAVVQCVVAAIQFTSDGNYWPLPWFSEQIRLWHLGPSAGYRRGNGLFLNANRLAWFLNILTFLALGVATIGRRAVWVKIVFAYLAAVCVAGTVLTLSRGGMIGLLVGMFVFLVLSLFALGIGAQGRRLAILLVTVAAVTTGLGGGYFLFTQSPTVQARMDRMTEDSYRIEIWPAALRQAQISPLTGTGAGSFTQISRRTRDNSSAADDTFAHNDWAQIVADFGFVGLVLVAAMFLVNWLAGFAGFVGALRQRMAISSRPQSNAAAFSMGALSALAACAAHSFFDFNMQVPANAILAAACAGMLANSGVVGGVRNAWIPRWTAALSACAAGVFLIVLLQKSAQAELMALRAENELILKNPAAAVRFAEFGLAAAPEHSRLRRLMGEALMQTAPASENPRETRVRSAYFLRRSTERDRDERWNQLMLGISLAGLKMTNAARAAHIEAIRLDPGSAASHEYYALFLEGAGKTPEAIRAYEVSLAVPGTSFASQRLRALRQAAAKPAK